MRVLHVIAGLGVSHGGPTVATSLMARACARAGMQVQVVSTNANGNENSKVPLDTDIEAEGVSYRYFNRDLAFYNISLGLTRWLRRNITSFDIVHAHALFNSASMIAARAARKAGVPYIIRPLGTLAPYGMSQHPLLKRTAWRLFDRSILQNAAAVHFTSVAERDEALRFGVQWRSEIVPLAVDTGSYSAVRDKSWLQARGADTTRTAFLFLSRLHEKKRVDLLLRAFAHIRAQATLIIAGSGEQAYERALRELAAKLGIADRIIWAGYVQGEEKRAVLAAADVFVLPSINENFGIAVVEAIACALPCILTSGVAVHREVEAANAGLISGGNESALTESMRTMLDPQLRHEMSGRARDLALRAFSLDALTRGLAGMYERAVA